jgi:hypothetical protein
MAVSSSVMPSVYAPTVGSLQSTADTVNKINIGATKAAQGARIPGGAGLEAQSSADIGSELKGEVPRDVLSLLAQQGAEGAVGSGGNPQAAYLRALGLTSLGQIQTGQQNLSAAEARNPAAPIYDIGSNVITPYQDATLNLAQGAQDLAKQKLEGTPQQLAEAQRAQVAAVLGQWRNYTNPLQTSYSFGGFGG